MVIPRNSANTLLLVLNVLVITILLPAISLEPHQQNASTVQKPIRLTTEAVWLPKNCKKAVSSKKQEFKPRNFVSSNINSGFPYAKAAKQEKPETTPCAQNSEPTMMEMMQNMIKMINIISDRLDKLEASSAGAIPKRIV